MTRLSQEYQAIGLDIGGTKMAGGVVSFPTATVLARCSRRTNSRRDPDSILEDALEMARELSAVADAQRLSITGIGLAVPELVDLEGNVTSAYNFDWRGMPLVGIFSELAPVVVDADVRVAGLGEAHYGAGSAFEALVYVTVGTGIGSCLVLSGEPYKGSRGSALTLASSPLSTICDSCGREIHPVLDRYASGPAIVARYNQASSRQVTTGQEVVAAASAGDQAAIEIVATAGRALGVSVAFLVNVLDPEAVVVGGGLGLAGGLFWREFTESTREHIWSETNRDLPILKAGLGDDAGIIGAATLARRAIEPEACRWGDSGQYQGA